MCLEDIQQIILTDGPLAALQFEVDLTRPYISDYFFDEVLHFCILMYVDVEQDPRIS